MSHCFCFLFFLKWAPQKSLFWELGVESPFYFTKLESKKMWIWSNSHTHSSIFSADSCLRVLVRWLRKEEEEEVETHKKKKIGIILQLVTMAAALQICKTGILQSPSRVSHHNNNIKNNILMLGFCDSWSILFYSVVFLEESSCEFGLRLQMPHWHG